MDDKKENPNISQTAEGKGIAQAAGIGATAISFFGVPLEKILLIEVITAIVIQGFGCALSILNPGWLCITFWLFPLLFSVPALHGLISGVSLRNKNIIILSLVSGLLSISFCLVVMLMYYMKKMGLPIPSG